jgi:hypothetical protein
MDRRECCWLQGLLVTCHVPGPTHVILACMQAVGVLLAHGALASERNAFGNTPLKLATAPGCVRWLQWVQQGGVEERAHVRAEMEADEAEEQRQAASSHEAGEARWAGCFLGSDSGGDVEFTLQ